MALLPNPAGLLGSSNQYIFGIANDFEGGPTPNQIVVGSLSGTVWKGFGSDRTARVFGSAGSLTADRVAVVGEADLVVLHETLTLNAQIFGGGPGTSLIKRGRGTVAFRSVDERVEPT